MDFTYQSLQVLESAAMLKQRCIKPIVSPESPWIPNYLHNSILPIHLTTILLVAILVSVVITLQVFKLSAQCEWAHRSIRSFYSSASGWGTSFVSLFCWICTCTHTQIQHLVQYLGAVTWFFELVWKVPCDACARPTCCRSADRLQNSGHSHNKGELIEL